MQNYFSRILRTVLRTVYEPCYAEEAHNGDNSLLLAVTLSQSNSRTEEAMMPNSVTIGHFHGWEYESGQSWLLGLQEIAKSNPNESYRLGRENLRGRAALLAVGFQGNDWASFEQWVKETLVESINQRQQKFFCMLNGTTTHCSLLDFVTMALEMAKSCSLDEGTAIKAILAKMPRPVQEKAPKEGFANLGEFLTFCDEQHACKNLRWQQRVEKAARPASKCNFCKKIGHVEDKCRRKKNAIKTAPQCLSVAWKKHSSRREEKGCGKKGDRPYVMSGQLNGTAAEMLIDTGASKLPCHLSLLKRPESRGELSAKSGQHLSERSDTIP
eukprot:GHVN01057474.1.p1 GENE.GHVN01057474.1~~GHVN01057474.1.p1  ORF type:complete len:327 (-),score=17.20 GHVN01057474.1:596-1576(-)